MARRVLHDRYFKQAKAEGYLARSAYKLIEIDDKFRLLKKGLRVLDLGCAPGSWLQVASKRVGSKGTVVGIDLTAVTHSFPSHVHTIQGDMRDVDPSTLLGDSGTLFDVVLSDMAPSTRGSGDAERSAHLCREILTLLPRVLKPGGDCVMKVLEGSEHAALLRECRAMFGAVKCLKPKACREASREVYIIGRYLKPQAPSEELKP